MSRESLRNGVVYSMQMNHGTIDSSGQNSAGTNNGATPITTGQKLGTGAYSFDGSNDYIDTNYSPNYTNDFSFSGWWYKSGNGSGVPTWLGTRDSTDPLIHIYENLGNMVVMMRDTAKNTNIITSTGITINTGQFYHLVFIWNSISKTSELFIDGVSRGTATNTNMNGDYGGKVILGRNGYSSEHYLLGIIDNLNIWNRALSSSEVSELYNSGDGLELFPNLADGVISAWKFDDNTGTTATDSALSGNDGTISGATWTTGKINSGLSFDNTGDEVIVSNENNFDFERTDSFSICAWYIKSNNPQTEFLINKRLTSSPFTGYSISFYNNKIFVDLTNSISNRISVMAPIPSFNNWHYLCMTYNGNSLASGIKIYVDGVEQTTTIDVDTLTSSMLNDRNLEIGNRQFAFNFNGDIDEPIIWNRALDSTEITNLYNSGDGLQYDFITDETVTYTAKFYNGTSWVEGTVKVYIGGEWVNKPIKVWSGSEWTITGN